MRFSRLRPPTLAEALAGTALLVAAGVPAQAAGLITGSQVKNNSLSGIDIRNGSLTAQDLSGKTRDSLQATPLGSIGSPQVVDGSLGSADITDNSLTAADLANGSVTATELGPGTVDGDELVDGSVRTADIGPDAVTSPKVADGGLTARDVGAFVGSVTLDFGEVPADGCKSVVSPSLTPVREGLTLADDVVVVTPPPSVSGLVQMLARPASVNTIRVTACNESVNPVALGSVTIRYLSIDGA